MKRQPRSPTQQQPPDSRVWQSSPVGSSLNARRNDNRSPVDEASHAVPTKRHDTQLFRNLSWTRPRSPPAEPVTPVVSEVAQRAGQDFNPEIEKAEVNGIKNVPTGPASKGCNPPVPQSILQLPHLFIPSRSIPALPTTTPHLAKLVQRHGPVHVVVDDTGYFIAFADSVEGRSKLHQCEKAHNNELLFGMYRIAMKQYPLGQPHSQNLNDYQSSAKLPTAETSPIRAAEGDTVLAKDLIANACGANRCVYERDAHDPEPSAKILGEDDNIMSGTDCRPLTSQPILANPYTKPLQPPRLLKNSPARPVSPLDSTSSISGRTGSDISGMGPRRCHVCKTRSGLDNLVKCTTCSRRYHRRCHTGKSIPAVIDDQWQCQRCERKKIPPRDTRPPHVGHSVDAQAASPPKKESTIPDVGLDGSLDHEQTTLFPAEQTEAWKLPDQVEHQQHRSPSPVPHPSVDAVVPHQMTTAATSMAPQPDPEQVQVELPHSEDVHFTEAQDLVEKSFSVAASSGPPYHPHGLRKPGKLQLTKRKRTDTDERVKPSEDDASIFNVPEGEGQSDTNALRPTNHLAPSTEVDDEPVVIPQRELPEAQDRAHDPEPKPAGNRPPVASASPVNGLLRTKRMKGPNPRMAPCVQCGAQTTKGLSGPATCLQCKKKAAAKLAADAARQNQEKSSLQASRQGTPGAASPWVSNATVWPSVEKDLPGRLVEGRDDNAQTVEAASAQHEDSASNVSFHDIAMADVVEQDNRDSDVGGDQDVGMVDVPDDIIASDQEDEDAAVLPGLLEASLLPSAPGRKKGGKRRSQRAAARDHYDLGNSFERPKGAYRRLAGIALYAADGNRLQTNRLVDWISKNIPGYDKRQGTWANGFKSTLRLNATGKSGKVICEQVGLTEGDDAGAGKHWWVLKPDVKDTVDRWDHSLQRPVPGPNAEPTSDISSLESSSDDDDDEEIQRQAEFLEPPPSARSEKLKSAQPTSRTPTEKKPYSATESIIHEEPTNGANGTSQDADSSDEEPLASQAKKMTSFWASDNQQNRTSLRSETFKTPGKAAPTSDTTSLATLLAAPGVHPVRDDLGIRMLIQEETENIDVSAKDLRHWPEYDPANRFNRDEKLAEIKARPSRKQLFGKPAGPLTSRSAPASASQFEVLRNAADFESVGKESEEMEKPCDSLADFLGVRDDVSYVPCIHKGFLAYKNPHVRNPNTTDIRLHT